MFDQNKPSRSGLQTAADLARAAKAAARIIRGAIAAGLHGAALAAAKEAMPFLLKLAVGLLIAVVLLPLLVFTAMPNIFFGYESASAEPLIQMREQALLLGGAYMSLEDFEKTQMDAVVTSIAAEYENAAIAVDKIEVESDFGEDDLCWLIAINSVAHQQNLDTMTVADIQNFCISRLSHTSAFQSLVSGNGLEETLTLKISFTKLDPEEVMTQLGFDEDAREWAGALYETLWESNALETYKDYFEAYAPSYGGDNSYTGSVDHGDQYDNTIDISDFVDPATKNNLDLAAYAVHAWENNWGYVWGSYGMVLPQSLLDYKIEQYPDIKDNETFIVENWLGRRTADCAGLIKGYGWLNPDTLSFEYGANGMQDLTADQMYTAAEESGEMEEMPEIVGLALWKEGHIGVYIGNGYAVEAMGTLYGVVRTEVEGRGWEGWCKLPSIEYLS